MNACVEISVATVNGIALHRPDEIPDAENLRQRACSELLRQAAVARGLLSPDDVAQADGILSEAATLAVEQLIEAELHLPQPSEDECRRYYAANSARYAEGERVELRHILFAVTAGVDVVALRSRAEHMLIELRGGDESAFADAARTWSNCPSGAKGGALGWLGAAECAPEFAREIFGHAEVGVLPRLVHSRFGLHVVQVLRRQAGAVRAFEDVRGTVLAAMRQKSFITALRQYLSVLAGEAEVRGVDIDGAASPLLQ
ncbi:peptidylprolyl isomerase [Propionivibrio dicarboxylicus]|uniref:peptidylprolyl isomerase n=1 Tax=Propionivibrio dicarboxylicus TaxID=83767 RepID=A0A1G8AIJ0_9RHOO|nr:peptidylprolyl isomerase [Propionivibrio dicarboxylicus]SDH20784.1 peptidyl-prolyl cis-trans isomerase C [Propionivibrio dicarboxylicus]